MLVWHQLHAAGNLDSDRVKALLRRMPYNHRQAHRRRERRERLPVNILGKGRLENVLPWLVRLSAFFNWDGGLSLGHGLYLLLNHIVESHIVESLNRSQRFSMLASYLLEAVRQNATNTQLR